MMKLFGAWITELVNIMLILNENKVKDIVMNLIALGVIAEIDNFYASRLFDFKCYQVLEDENLPFKEKGGTKGFKPNLWNRF